MFVLSTGAAIDLASGSAVDFTAGPVQYLVTAESGESRSWTVSASCDTFTQIGAGPDEEGVDVATDSSGNVYVIGKFWDASMVADRGFCVKYGKSGRLVWRRNFDYSDLRGVKKIKVEGDSIYIAGDVYDVPTGGGDAGTYVFLRKFNTAGIDLVSVIRGSGNGDEVIDMVVSNGTAYILTETRQTVFGTVRHKTAVYAIEENQWDWIYLTATEDTSDWGTVAVTGTGQVYALSEVYDGSVNPVSNNLKMTSLVFEQPFFGASYKELTVQWSGMITESSYCNIYSAASDADGNIILSGFFTLGTDEKYTLMKVSPTGEILWTYTDPDGFFMTGLYKHPRGIAVDSENNIFIHGAMHCDGDVWTGFIARHGSDGERLWIFPYAELTGYSQTGGIALYDNDAIYCTGTIYSWGSIDGKSPVNDNSYYLLRYDRYGNRQ